MTKIDQARAALKAVKDQLPEDFVIAGPGAALIIAQEDLITTLEGDLRAAVQLLADLQWDTAQHITPGTDLDASIYKFLEEHGTWK